MPFSPLDLQVAVQQAGRVANEVTAEREAPENARAARAKEEIEERKLEENTTDESGDTEENNAIGEKPEGSNQGYQGSGGPKEEEEKKEKKQGQPDSPGIGNYLDVTT
ncbi:MAG: hypothetical protein ACLFN5_01660 [bacterium]